MVANVIVHRFVTCFEVEETVNSPTALAPRSREPIRRPASYHIFEQDCLKKYDAPLQISGNPVSVTRCRKLALRKRSHHHGDLSSLLSFLLRGCRKQVSRVFKIYFAVHAGKRHTDHRADLTSAILPFRSFSTRMTSLFGLLSRSTYSTISRSGRRSLYSTIS
jgi:hypothetical protein